MKKASIIVQDYYKKNKLFDLNDKIINRDNCMFPFFLLKEKFEEIGYDLSTQDINSIEESEIVIYNEMPERVPDKVDKEKSFLLIYESELIRPDNWDFNNHKYFHKIFTWKDDIVDNNKYFKFNFAQEISQKISKNLSDKENLCTLIAGNKKNTHPLELYSERINAIKWFEKNHPNDFEFYGVGWDKYSSSNKYIDFFLKKLPISPYYKRYRGKVENKKETLQRYKFAICYENAKNISGYITEKIFDCFFAGCVPIYWGANNVTEHIPKECFIDKRDFNTYEELYKYINEMSEKNYLQYLENIELYLSSRAIKQFSSEYFANTIIKAV